mmetsp:Transcript_76489/g.127462  ORF Transcript_76489/g.127462 Transcript_76489/m.127462 type:complete len:205 (+) Transcript_76489:25-639(+)
MAATSRATGKVVLLGEGRVGKTSLVIRYCRDSFNEVEASTVQASYFDKQVAVGDKRINLAIWDTAGQERFHALGPIYYRDADAALLVFDITDVESFSRVKSWVRELRKMVGEEIVLCIVGNKIDLERQRLVGRQEAQEYAQSVGARFGETSAKTGRGIDEVFTVLARRLLDSSKFAAGTAFHSCRGGLIADEAEPEETRRKGCC